MAQAQHARGKQGAKRRAAHGSSKELRRLAGDVLQGVLTMTNVVEIGKQPGIAANAMKVRVVSDEVSFGRNPPHDRVVLRRAMAHQEKDCAGLIGFESLKDRRRHRWMRSVVER